jgi:hypothetical protein
MTSTITAPRHARLEAEPRPWSRDAVTEPVPLQVRFHHPDPPRASRPGPLRWIGAGVLATGLLLGTGAGAYALGHHDATPAPVAAAATPAALPTTTVRPTTGAVTAGPQLVDTAGRPVEDATAAQVRVVYTALQHNDIEALKRSEGAAGSDDGLTSFPHLTNASTRNRLLGALQTRPVRNGNSYRYRAGGYALEFQQAHGPLGTGLSSISGPWTAASSTSPTTTASHSTTSAPNTAVFPYGNGPTGRHGDGCGPYEHNIGGYCSPDTDVLDENGNPDPKKAEVPGNLKNPQHGD